MACARPTIPALMEELARRGIVLEVCPGSNVALGLYPGPRRPSAAPVDRGGRPRHAQFRRPAVLPHHARHGIRRGGSRGGRPARHHADGDRGVVRRRGDQAEAVEGRWSHDRKEVPGARRRRSPCSAPGAVQAQEPAPNDMLLATLWTQRSVEYKGNALTVFALAKIRLDQALADKSWTAAPGEQKGDFQNLPPAVVLDVDETAARQLALSGLDAEEQPDLQHQDLERVLRRPGLARHPGRRRVHQVRRFQGREGLLHQQPRRRRPRRTRARTWRSSASRWAATSTPS